MTVSYISGVDSDLVVGAGLGDFVVVVGIGGLGGLRPGSGLGAPALLQHLRRHGVVGVRWFFFAVLYTCVVRLRVRLGQYGGETGRELGGNWNGGTGNFGDMREI